MTNRLLIISVFFLFCNCSGNTSKGLLPPSSGDWGEIILVMDSAKWEGELGSVIKETFQPRVEGLPREEPLFTIHVVNPLKLNGILKSSRYMIFVTSFESVSQQSGALKNYFTQESIGTIMQDSSRFLHINENEFAKGQKVMYLFGQNDRQLIQNIRNNRKALQEFFNDQETKRLISSIYAGKEVKGINEHLVEEHQFLIRVPFGYQIADERENFIWLRNIGAETDKNIFVSYQDYYNEEQLSPEYLVDWRDQIGRKYIFEDPERPNTFVMTERDDYPVLSEVTNINNRYTVNLRGLWHTNNLSMGGPFISYSFVDESLNRIYYIEGFLFSPGKPQRESLRELRTILSTFQSSSELRKSS